MTELSRSTADIYGSFFLSDTEYAIPARAVQEVVNSPGTFTAVPLAPHFLEGLFDLRGTIIPVINLQKLLNLAPSSFDQQKIAILEMNSGCVGLLFDRTGEIFRSREEEHSDFNENDDSVISGVFKKEKGKRILQILDVGKIFQLHNVPKDAVDRRSGRTRAKSNRGERQQCISFMVGSSNCAIQISGIQEILKISEVDQKALISPLNIGSIDLRGVTVPIIDFPAILKYREPLNPETKFSENNRVIIMRLEKELFGLLVDAVNSIVSFYPDELLAFPSYDQTRAEMFKGCLSGHGSDNLLLLDHEQIFSESEISKITKGHSRLFQKRDISDEEKKSEKSRRQTYISFEMNGSYAIPIGDVCEIIHFPQEVLKPPGRPQHVIGVLNLRGKMVTIIDARILYAEVGQQEVDLTAGKVFIIQKEGHYFGLTVQSVESLHTVLDTDKVKLPSMLYDKGATSITADLAEAVEVPDGEGKHKNLLVLNVDSLLARASVKAA